MTRDAMLSITELAAAVQGQLTPADALGAVFGVTTDSRAVVPGGLFIALAGDKFDGHDFVAVAEKAGAACALVHRDLAYEPRIAVIRVADTRLALGTLAGWWRERYRGRLVALTGSNGKTTVKEMAAAILRESCRDDSAVLATEGNFNNDIGMPLTLLKLRKQHRYAVIEMGMNHLREIDYLTRIARPDVALVNNAHRAHVGELGSMAAVAQAKGEIFAGLTPDGTALFNADDRYADVWKQMAEGKKQLSFGLDNGDIRCRYRETPAGAQLEITLPDGVEIKTALRVPGEHNVRNAVAACAIAVALNAAPQAIARGLTGYAGTKGRLQRKGGINGALVIDDTYNANPDSMAAAIAVLARAAGSKVLVMGDMGELGADAAALHAETGRLAKQSGIDRLFALGDFTPEAVAAFGGGGRHFAAIADLVLALRPLMQKGATVLVKGSRFMRMERAVEAITVPTSH